MIDKWPEGAFDRHTQEQSLAGEKDGFSYRLMLLILPKIGRGKS
jgi:hypothetical protein